MDDQAFRAVERLCETCDLGDEVVVVLPQCACDGSTKLREPGDMVTLCDDCGGARKAFG